MSGVLAMAYANKNGFTSLYAYLVESWHIGKGKVNLWSYLFVGIVGIGGLGIWTSILLQIQKWRIPEALLSLITCAIPIIASACLDFIFDQEKRRFLIGFSISVAFIVFVLNIFAAILSNRVTGLAYLLAIVSMVIACGMWWIANARNRKLDNGCNYLTPIGSVEGVVGGSEGGFML